MSGVKVAIENGKLVVPNDSIIPFIEGDGIDPDTWAVAVRVFDAVAEKAYGGDRKVHWIEAGRPKSEAKLRSSVSQLPTTSFFPPF